MADLIIRALEHIWTTLASRKLPMAVMGGIAVSLWKHIRATEDVDVLVALDAEDEVPVLQTLIAAGFRPKHEPPILKLGAFRLLQVFYEPPGAHIEVQVGAATR